jgi:DnaK suppressor protein
MHGSARYSSPSSCFQLRYCFLSAFDPFRVGAGAGLFTNEQTETPDFHDDAWRQEDTVTNRTINRTMDSRERDLRRILHDRQREIEGDVRTRIRDARTDRASDVFDELDHSDAAMQEEMDFALIQMKAETLARVDEALARLDAGQYGRCFECGGEIAEKRLRALPFAER